MPQQISNHFAGGTSESVECELKLSRKIMLLVKLNSLSMQPTVQNIERYPGTGNYSIKCDVHSFPGDIFSCGPS